MPSIQIAGHTDIISVAPSAGAQSIDVAGNGKIMVGEYRYDGKPAKGRLSMYDSATHELSVSTDIGLVPLTAVLTRWQAWIYGEYFRELSVRGRLVDNESTQNACCCYREKQALESVSGCSRNGIFPREKNLSVS